MKSYKKLKLISLILLILLIILTSFIGFYKKEEYHVINLVKNYMLGMEFQQRNLITLTVDDSVEKIVYDKDGNKVEQEEGKEYTEEAGYKIEEVKANDKAVLTADNYKKTEKILKKRLREIGQEEYKSTLNKENGEIKIELPETEEISLADFVLTSKGELAITDAETGEQIFDRSNVEDAKIIYGPIDNENIAVYLQINFNKDSMAKLEEISKIYVATTEDAINEKGETEQQENIKYISILVDGQEYSKTYFGETMTTGILYVPLTQTSDTEELQEYIKSFKSLETVINNGPIDIAYTRELSELEPAISARSGAIAIGIFVGVLLLAFIFLIIKFRLKGLLAVLIEIGYAALLLLVIRYTNVIVTLEGAIGLAISIIMNYVLVYMILRGMKEEEWKFGKTLLKFFLITIPIYVFAVVFSFIPYTNISSLGMNLFWGSAILYLYNCLFTNTMLKMIDKK